LTLDGMCDLAHAWWADRLDPGWTPRPREESQVMLERLGLTGPFWQLEEKRVKRAAQPARAS
jgi:hypothetical protein